MTTIDFSPLYRNSVGFDRVAKLLDAALGAEQASPSYPPYNIEVTGENRYAITLAVAGFAESELTIQTERGVLSVRGKRSEDQADKQRTFLHRGIANRSFERKFNLAEHVEVAGARLADGMLTIELVKEVPEAMKPRSIAINGGGATLIAESGDTA